MSYDQQLADALREVTSLRAELEQARQWADLVTKGKSPCGHWKAYAVTEDGGKHITCLQCDKHQAERALEQARQEIDAAWFGIQHGYDIEPREYFEKEAPTNGFKFALAQAIHHIWKRDPRREKGSTP